MKNNLNLHPKIIARASAKMARVAPMRDYEVFPASGATRVISQHSSMLAVPIDINDPEKGYVVIDAGANKQAKELKRFLASRQLGLDAVEAVIVSHVHSDHTAGLHTLHKNVRTLVSAEDRGVLLGDRHSEGPLPSKIDQARGWLNMQPWAAVPGIEPEIIEEGKVYTFGDLSVLPIPMPGHTPGSRAFFVGHSLTEGQLPLKGDLVVGDALDFDKQGNVLNANKNFTNDTEASLAAIAYLSDYVEQQGFQVGDVIPSHSASGKIEAVHSYKRAAA